MDGSLSIEVALDERLKIINCKPKWVMQVHSLRVQALAPARSAWTLTERNAAQRRTTVGAPFLPLTAGISRSS